MHPNYICSQCEANLISSYEFQQLSLKSHKTILEYTIPNILVDVKPSFLNLVTLDCDDKEVKEENDGTVEEISVIYENSDNEKDDNSSDEDYIAEDDEDHDKPKKRGNKSPKSRSTKRVFICKTEEVKKCINDVKTKFYTSRNCLFCGFLANNVRTLSVHMSRLHWSYKDKWCWKCNKVEDDLKQHSETHKDDFKCPFCNKQSTTSSHFVEHLERHTVKLRHICKICGSHLKTTKLLKAHCRKKHNKLVSSCNICLEDFLDKKLLLEHLKTHKTIKCDKCKGKYSDENFDTHVCPKEEFSEETCDEKQDDDIENTNEENIGKVKEKDVDKKSDIKRHRYCGLCKRTVRNLENHRNKHHSKDGKKDEPKALCTYCGKQFKQQSNLDVHMRTHTKETPYKCSYCDMSVATRTRLVDHERTHTGEKPFVCRFCGKAFKQHGVLNTHLKIHTGRTEQCLLCPKRFCRPSELRNHMRVHTGEKPYACSYCDKCFIQRSHLVEHTKIHTDHRPFKCNVCGKAFKQSSTLKGHLNVHEGKKMFKCTICSYCCRKSYTLKQHLLQHQNTSQEQKFSCEICQETFFNLEQLNVHRNTPHQESLAMTENIALDIKF